MCGFSQFIHYHQYPVWHVSMYCETLFQSCKSKSLIEILYIFHQISLLLFVQVATEFFVCIIYIYSTVRIIEDNIRNHNLHEFSRHV